MRLWGVAVSLKLDEFEKSHRQFHGRKLELIAEPFPALCSQPLKTCWERALYVGGEIGSLRTNDPSLTACRSSEIV